ncbi:family 43 glycosylhydrolase [Catalinimonas sp. 4WD22]|uniref:family 43 glycosylhydrolase n=1 Tax=Catalinimonas locisalis TaxID=3133978 RepID=UPI0031011CFD
MSKRSTAATTFLLLSLSFTLWMTQCASPPQEEEEAVYLFSYFTGNGEDGLHLAWSENGLKWEALNDGQSYLQPLVGESTLMRDPCITQTPDGTFHMVWTTSWQGNTIGYAHSDDLIHWSEQIAIPVMAHEDSVRNCWAPEINYILEEEQFIIYWSSTVTDKFLETANSTKDSTLRNHRIYYTLTSDFEEFTPTELLYDPGFNAIDASIYPLEDRYLMFIKDESELPEAQKNISIAYADEITGPYQVEGEPISGDYWAEGPTAAQIDGTWHLYFDKYRKGEFGLLVSDDLQSWEEKSEQLEMPEGIRHGTIFRVSRDVLQKLQEQEAEQSMLYRDISRKGRPYAKDPSVVKFQGRYYMYHSLPPDENGAENKSGWNIGIAVSDDLKHWEKLDEILPQAEYESKGLCAPGALVHEGKVHLFYQTYGNAENDAICHAWSEDGIHFQRDESNPIFSPTGDWNVGRAIDADVFIHQDTAYLYWATRDPAYEQQMVGVSVAAVADGFGRSSWKQISQEPLLKPELPWEMNCIEASSVCKIGDIWYMFYAGAYNHEGQQIGLARSEDGIHWERVSDEPVLPKGENNAWNATESGHPGVFIDEDGSKYLFYQGNPDKGYTYYLSAKRWEMKDGKPTFSDL